MNANNNNQPNNIETDPNAMIPLLPGESYHIGYEGITEDLAFNPRHVGSGSPSFDPSAPKRQHEYMPIRIPRGRISCDRLVMLIHKFITLTRGAVKKVPKHELSAVDMIDRPRRSLYYANIRYSVLFGDTCELTVRMNAYKYRDEEYVQVTVDYNRGLSSVLVIFLENLRTYLESDGAVFRRVDARDVRKIDVSEEDDLIEENDGDTQRIRMKPSEDLKRKQTYAGSAANPHPAYLASPAAYREHYAKLNSTKSAPTVSIFNTQPAFSLMPKLSLVMPFDLRDSLRCAAEISPANPRTPTTSCPAFYAEPEPDQEEDPALPIPVLTRSTNAAPENVIPSNNLTYQDIDAMFSIVGGDVPNNAAASVDPLTANNNHEMTG